MTPGLSWLFSFISILPLSVGVVTLARLLRRAEALHMLALSLKRISREALFPTDGTCIKCKLSSFLHNDDQLCCSQWITTESQQPMIC